MAAHRSIFESFALAPDPAGWLRDLVDDSLPGDVRVPRDADPLNHLIAMVTDANDRQVTERLAKAAGVLLRFLAISTVAAAEAVPADLTRLGSVLKVFEAVPARPEVSRLLYALLQCDLFGADSASMRDRRRKALIALAISPPPDLPVGDIIAMFRRETRDSRFALAAFGGMCRLALAEAIAHLPDLLEMFADDEVARRLALMTLTRRLADRPDLAARLRDVLVKSGLADVALRSLAAIGVRESAPTLWQVLTDGAGSARRSRPTPPTGLRVDEPLLKAA